MVERMLFLDKRRCRPDKEREISYAEGVIRPKGECSR